MRLRTSATGPSTLYRVDLMSGVATALGLDFTRLIGRAGGGSAILSGILGGGAGVLAVAAMLRARRPARMGACLLPRCEGSGFAPTGPPTSPSR